MTDRRQTAVEFPCAADYTSSGVENTLQLVCCGLCVCCVVGCYCKHTTVCCAKDDASKRRKLVQCSAETVAEDGLSNSTRSEFVDADKLFAYMIEPVTPPKFFTWVLSFSMHSCTIAVLILRIIILHYFPVWVRGK